MNEKKKKWSITATVVGGKYIGEIEAATKKEAMEKALNMEEADVRFCHQCSGECENAELTEFHAELVEGERRGANGGRRTATRIRRRR